MPCASPNETWGLEGPLHRPPRVPQPHDGERAPTDHTHARKLERVEGELVKAGGEAGTGSRMGLLSPKGALCRDVGEPAHAP